MSLEEYACLSMIGAGVIAGRASAETTEESINGIRTTEIMVDMTAKVEEADKIEDTYGINMQIWRA